MISLTDAKTTSNSRRQAISFAGARNEGQHLRAESNLRILSLPSKEGNRTDFALTKVFHGAIKVSNVSPIVRLQMIRIPHVEAGIASTGAFTWKKNGKVSLRGRTTGRRFEYNLRLIPSEHAALKRGVLPLIRFDITLGCGSGEIAIDRRLLQIGHRRHGFKPDWLAGFSRH